MELFTGKKSEETLQYLLHRRSASVKEMSGPGPSREQLEIILKAAARVPDHGRTVPFYFIIFEGAARERAGDIIAEAFRAQNPNAPEQDIAAEKERFLRAPVVVGVIYRARKAKNPLWEQIMTCGAVCQNMLLAASAMGFGAQWLSEWTAYDHNVKTKLGLDERDHVAGFIYLGTPVKMPEERARPDLESIINYWEDGQALKKGDQNDQEKFGFPKKGFDLSGF